MTDAAETIRLDKWLWQARFFKTRGLATRLVGAGRVRVDGQPVSKPARAVGPGAVLTFPQGDQVRVVRVLACGLRRGPAPEARALYEDLTEWKTAGPRNPAYDGGGRPDRRDRDALARLRGRGDA
ncbi:MAG: ribosome-associated heat shock protein Hsp15 HslR [Rhodobacteraceae bacterium HLUCCA08]|nr:MAG: ribosome-associated heat shock protein Hsp15 HslR [Rhodobacteraceae bacterium HLUCCA08]